MEIGKLYITTKPLAAFFFHDIGNPFSVEKPYGIEMRQILSGVIVILLEQPTYFEVDGRCNMHFKLLVDDKLVWTIVQSNWQELFETLEV